MKLLLITGAALMTASPAPPIAKPGQPPARFQSAPMTCDNLALAEGRSSGEFRKLGELPPADAYQAVYRTDDKGCPDPMLVSERINGRR